MTKVELAEKTLYDLILPTYHKTFFVGIGKHPSNEMVLVVYLDVSLLDTRFRLPASWEGFRVVVKDTRSMFE